MTTAKPLTSGARQSVCLPSEFHFDDEEVLIARIDDMVILYSRRKGWDLLAKALDRFTDDFMAERDPPVAPRQRRPS